MLHISIYSIYRRKLKTGEIYLYNNSIDPRMEYRKYIKYELAYIVQLNDSLQREREIEAACYINVYKAQLDVSIYKLYNVINCPIKRKHNINQRALTLSI